jgi:hypothetical protein
MKRLLIARPLALPLMLPLVVALFASASLFVKPHLALGEGSVPDPSVTMISKQVDRITALRKELETAHVRIMSSPSLPKTGQMAIRTIDGTLSVDNPLSSNTQSNLVRTVFRFSSTSRLYFIEVFDLSQA